MPINLTNSNLMGGNTKVCVCLGLNRRTRLSVGGILIDSLRVNSISRLAGSYHILEMGRHFEEYTVNSGNMPPLVPWYYFQQMPSSTIYAPLDEKQRAAGVTANIGEAIGALAARKIMDLDLDQV